jgi:hypothetical protein
MLLQSGDSTASHDLRAICCERSKAFSLLVLTSFRIRRASILSSYGKMVFTILGAVGELERSLICERVVAGQRAAKANGVRFRRPRTSAPLRSR